MPGRVQPVRSGSWTGATRQAAARPVPQLPRCRYRLKLLRPKGGFRAVAQLGAGSAFFTSAMYSAALGPVARITTAPYSVVWPLGYAAWIFDIPASSDSRLLNW